MVFLSFVTLTVPLPIYFHYSKNNSQDSVETFTFCVPQKKENHTDSGFFSENSEHLLTCQRWLPHRQFVHCFYGREGLWLIISHLSQL